MSLPALSSSLAIFIVFVPVAFLAGVSKSLFLPLAEAVVLAMLPSYFLSRTLVTTMMQALLHKEVDLHRPLEEGEESHPSREGLLWRLHEAIEARFERMRDAYRGILAWALDHRAVTITAFGVLFCGSLLLFPIIGQDFFPTIDAGQMRLHVRAPSGTRLEETGRLFSRIEATIREVVPRNELALVLDNLGLAGGLNYAFNNSGTIGGSDGDIVVSLTEKHHSTFGYMTDLRKRLRVAYPNCTFYFQPADMATQVLNFGTSAPIDIQVTGPYRNQEKNYDVAQAIQKQVAAVPGIVDSYVYQVTDAPEQRINVGRVRAEQLGETQQNVAGYILVSLSASSLTAPSYFIDPKNGVQYTVSVQTPQYRVQNLDALLGTPIATTNSSSGQKVSELLSNVADVTRDTTASVISHYNIQPVYDVYAGVQDRDLGSATADVEKVVGRLKKQLPRGSTINIVGQAQTMRTSFRQMAFGLVFAIVLVYLLLAITFESWKDPVVILTATPGALAGVVWMLYATQTTFNVPSLMGTIMSVGVATANSILLVTFANEQQDEGKDPVGAALEAGFTRFRPVIMTALAMILGMLPMALGLGEGGEQNAPLGRAVIGGLCLATFSTLLFVPLMYTFAGRHEAARSITPATPIPETAPAPRSGNRPSRRRGVEGA